MANEGNDGQDQAGGDSQQDGQEQATDTASQEAGNALDSMLKSIADRESGGESVPVQDALDKAGGKTVEAEKKTDDESGGEVAGADGEQDKDDAGKKDDAGGETEPQLTKRQKNTAEHFGWTSDDIKTLGEKAPAMLDKLAEERTELSRQQVEVGKRLADMDAAADKGGGKEDGDQEGSEGSDDSKGGADGADGKETEAEEPPKPEDLEEYAGPQEAVAMAVAISKHEIGNMREDVDALRGEVQDFMQGARQREADLETNRFWLGLDEAHAEQYGVGPTEELPEGSPEREERLAVETKAKQLRRGQAFGAGHREMPWNTALNQGLLIRSPHAQSQATQRQGAEDGDGDGGDKQDRTDQIIGQPGSKQTGTGKTRQEQAETELDEKLAKFNAPD